MQNILFLFFLTFSTLLANDLRDQAEELHDDNKKKQVIEAYQKLVETVSDEHSGDDIETLVKLLVNSKQINKVDHILEQCSKKFSSNPQALLGIAKSYQNIDHKAY